MAPLSATLQSVDACEERTRLLEDYARATERYFDAVTCELERYRAVFPTADYQELHRGAEQARCFLDHARRALHRHITEHRCGSAYVSSASSESSTTK